MSAADAIAPLRAWLRDWQAAVRAVDFEAGQRMCAPEIVAFGTVAPFVEGIENVMAAQWHKVWGNIREFTMHEDRARGAIAGDHGWVATTWDSLGTRPDGSTGTARDCCCSPTTASCNNACPIRVSSCPRSIGSRWKASRTKNLWNDCAAA